MGTWILGKDNVDQCDSDGDDSDSGDLEEMGEEKLSQGWCNQR